MATIEKIEEGDGVITVYFSSPYEVEVDNLRKSVCRKMEILKYFLYKLKYFLFVKTNYNLSDSPPARLPVSRK